ncbi:hypothetical protein LIZ76_14720 [Caldibacillus sp. 210928-DFI.2.22]|uniref:hypothetical protein n=1 Tax=unclassified Caldibacillus TaxID=2641266 RepID=UPI001D06C88B|nr:MULTISPECIES: hypothetical protein [unclassified Caldibacillus]MCB7071190.1 hypothetical protein [Caldibacillus sp. 210928-DFI.2.22]MCB7074651.1 hypothetical protein [Caldibacillus sp. 210928-DFI.2.18]
MLLNNSMKQSIYEIDAFLENYTLGTLIIDDKKAYLELDIGELIELDDTFKIQVINNREYIPVTYNQAINTIDKYMNAPLFAGFLARVKQKR